MRRDGRGGEEREGEKEGRTYTVFLAHLMEDLLERDERFLLLDINVLLINLIGEHEDLLRVAEVQDLWRRRRWWWWWKK